MSKSVDSVSIIIPSFNRAYILRDALDSIRSQTSNNWECIVVDDFSADKTKEIVEEYSKADPRFSYILNAHKKGAQGARNTGLDKARFNWVVFFDSDDKMHPRFVEILMNHIETIGDAIDVLACISNVVDIEKNEVIGEMNPKCHGDIHDNLFSGKSYVANGQCVIRRSKLMEIGGLDEDCPSMQEWDTHIRLSRIARYDMLENTLMDYRVGRIDTISSNGRREVIGRMYILRKFLQEWKARSDSLTSFVYQIYQLLCTNEDKDFCSSINKELHAIVPFCSLRIAYCVFRNKLFRLKGSLTHRNNEE